jgi:signal transduction histidine kinase
MGGRALEGRVIRLIKRIVSIGVDESVSDFDAQRIRTLNVGVLLAVSMAVLPLPFYLQIMGIEALVGPVLFTGISAGVLWLQNRHRAYEAALVLNILGILLISLQWHILGEDYGVHFWYLALILFPFISFPRASAWTPLLLGILSTLIFADLAQRDQQVQGYPMDALRTQIMASLLLLGMSIVFRLLVSRVEGQVLRQQEQIDEAKRVIEQYPEQDPNPILRLDGEGRLVYGNPSGLEVVDQMGLALGDHFPMALSGDFEVVESRSLVELEVGDRPFQFKISPVAEFGFFNLYGTDMTPFKELEAARVEISRTLGREREVSRLKEEFLASMSHELRTPLNAVLGLSEALQEEVYGPLTEKQGESLQTIWDSGQKLLTMFDDLLDFSRIGAGRFPTQITPVNLRSCIQMVIRSQTRALSEAGIRLSLDEGEGDAVAMVDMRHVQRILKMLLENAIKFTPRGGQVGIELRQAEVPNQIEIVVWDTGIGIPREKQALLFEPFVQVEGGLARRYGGAGLGLALTSRLVRLLGAELEVESAEGEGSRFILKLPRDAPAQLEVFADLRCPFCFVLSEWLDEANLSHLVRWRCVEERPGLTPELARSFETSMELDEELHRVSQMAPGIRIVRPSKSFDTRRAMLVIERVQEADPSQGVEVRGRLYRAIWQEGRDLTEWSAIAEVLSEFSLGDLDDEAQELQTLLDNTAEWRQKGKGRIPMLFSLTQGEQWHGLGQRSALLAFVESQLRKTSSLVESG